MVIHSLFRRIIIFQFVFACCVLSAKSSGEYYYYFEGQKIDLVAASEGIVVRFDDQVQSSDQKSLLDSALTVSVKEILPIPVAGFYFVEFSEPQNADAIAGHLEKLAESDKIAFSAPVLKLNKLSTALHLVTDEFIVQFAKHLTLAEIQNIVARESSKIVKDMKRNVFVLRATGKNGLQKANEFMEKHSTDVIYAEPNFVYRGLFEATVNDPLHPEQWAHKNTSQTLDTDGGQGDYGFPTTVTGTPGADMNVEAAWDVSTGSGILIGIIDSGVDLDHPDLQGNIANSGWDAAEQDYNANDDDDFGNGGHGTGVAGLAAAVGNNGIGVAGVAYDAQILPIRIFGDNGSSASLANIAAAIDTTWMWGADVLSNSWGGYGYSPTIAAAFNRAQTQGRNGKGCVILAASGNNDYHHYIDLQFPASLSYVIAVGATNMHDEKKNPGSGDGQFWWGGNYGSNLSVSAPTINYTTDIAGIDGFDPSDYFSKFNGTSASTPNAAGVAALVLAANPNLTADEVKNILESTADNVDIYPYDTPAANGDFNNRLGYGRVNAYAAVQEALGLDYTPPSIVFMPITDITGSGEQVLSATITDASGIAGGADQPVLYYRVETNGTPGSWMSVNDADGPAGNMYEFVIPGQPNQSTVEYYVAAKDGSSKGNTGSFPFGAVDNTGVGDIPPPTIFQYSASYISIIEFSSMDVPVEISNGAPDIYTSTLTVDSSFSIADLNLTINLTHTWVLDLSITLTSPNGTSANLIGNVGIGDNFWTTILDDEATDLIINGSTPFDGSYQPEYPLSVFDGENAQGVWQLTIVDRSYDDGGSLWFWGLAFSQKTNYLTPQDLTASPTTDQILLKWNAVKDVNIHKYNIYRDMTSPAVTLIDSVVGSAPLDSFYLDTNVTPGQLYYYRVTAVSNTGNEGVFSNEILMSPRTTTFVDAVSGSNTMGFGTESNPWKTITFALNKLSEGFQHTVQAKNGTYDYVSGESFPLEMKDGVSLKGAGVDSSIIDATGTNTVIKCIGILDTSTTIEGFTIKGGDAEQGAGLYISNGSMLKITNNKITENIISLGANNGFGGGIYIKNSSPTILNNEIIANRAQYSGGIYITENSSPKILYNTLTNYTTLPYTVNIHVNESSPLIKGNKLSPDVTQYSFEGAGISINGVSSSPRIINNIIFNHTSHGIAYSSSGHAVINNNTITDNAGDGILIGSSATPDSIVNNIIAFNAGYGIREYDSTADPGIVSYNLFFNNDNGFYLDEGTDIYVTANEINVNVAEANNNIEGDPLFVNKANSDYHLQVCSPAIDKGDPSFPFENEPQPNGNRINSGAYGNTTEAAITDSGNCNLPELLYVDAVNGDNNGDGSQANPWKTITYALSHITDANNHSILVAPGTYDPTLGESFPLQMKDGISLIGTGIDISIIDANGTNTVIKCVGIVDTTTTIKGFTIKNGTSDQGGGLFITGNSRLKIQNNKITRNGTQNLSSLTRSGGGIYITNASPTIINNEIVSNAALDFGGGVYIGGNSSAKIINNILLNGNRSSQGIPGVNIYINSSSPLIKENEISPDFSLQSQDGSGIYVSGVSSSPRIINNIISTHTSEGIVNYSTSGNAIIYNNTITRNDRDGILIGSSATPDSIVNNIIAFNAGYGIREYDSAADPGTVSYNLLYGNTNGHYLDEGNTVYYTVQDLNASVAEAENNLDDDPLFTDRLNNNLHLQLCSPGIDAGDPSFSYDEEPLPNGNRINLGAYGNTSSATITDQTNCLMTELLYVDAVNGDNQNGDGTFTNPWQTISYALSHITDTERHTIVVAPGSYDTSLGENFPLLMKDRISIIGAGIDSSIIDAGLTNTVIKCISILDSLTTIEGFTIKRGLGGRGKGGGLFIAANSQLTIKNNKITENRYSDGAGIRIVASSPRIIKNMIENNVDNSEASGIYLSDNSSAIIVNNTIKNDGTSYIGQIKIINSSPYIKGNFISSTNNLRGDGITVLGSISSPKIINNIITHSPRYGLNIVSNSAPRIFNNTISGNGEDGIYLQSTASPDSIVNNIISFNNGYGVRETSADSDPGLVSYNLFYSNGNGHYLDEGSIPYLTVNDLNANVPEAGNNIEGDPLFVDKANDDYNLLSGSPAIDSGNPLFFDPDGTRSDIGALYFKQNDAPIVVSPIVDVFYAEDSGEHIIADLNTVFSDPNAGDELQFSAVSANPAIIPAIVNTELRLNTLTNFYGNGEITVTATDSIGLQAQDVFTATITPVNDPPVITDSLLSDITFPEDHSVTFDLDTMVVDVDHDTSALMWSVEVFDAQPFSFINKENAEKKINQTKDRQRIAFVSQTSSATPYPKDNQKGLPKIELVNDSDLQVSIDSTTHIVTIQASPDSSGIFDVRFTVSDPEGLSDSDSISVTVIPVNDAPVFSDSLPDISFPEDSSHTVSLDNYLTDVDNSPSNIQWTWQVLDARPITTNRMKTIVPVMQLGKTSENNVETGVATEKPTTMERRLDKGGQNTTSERTTEIRVDPGDLQIDIDSTTHIATFSVTGDTSGVFTVVFKATDPGGLSDTDTLLVTVFQTSDPPVLLSPLPDVTFAEDSGPHLLALLDTVFADPDPGNVFTYTISSNNANIDVSTQADSLILHLAKDSSGVTTVIVTATDLTAQSISDTFVIEIYAVNDTPTVLPLPLIIFDEDSSYTFDLDSLVNDVDHDTTRISWQATFPSQTTEKVGKRFAQIQSAQIVVEGVSPTLPKIDIRRNFSNLTITAGSNDSLQISIDPISHEVFVTATPNFNGLDIPILFTATDDSGASASGSTTITVTPVNDPPVFTAAIPDTAFNEDDTLSYAIENWFPYVTDPDVSPGELSYAVISGAHVTAAPGNAIFRLSAPENWFGLDTLRVIVSDSVYADTADFYITVNSVNDLPEIDLPDTLQFHVDSTATLSLWNYVSDVETPDSLLTFSLSAASDSLQFDFDAGTGIVTLNWQSPFVGRVYLTVVVGDENNATAIDSIEVSTSPIVGIADDLAGLIPSSYILEQNYPNPFNPLTIIRFGLPKATNVKLTIYNILGEQVSVLVDGQLLAGYHTVSFNASQHASGIFFYILTTNEFKQVRKMILMK
ncbi:MAG: right-handed parallel beta-helix repeat-containing protein [Calditrichaeota bacterium]|nr:right-handed parallel beta-helix repeat-containing protein [Calditrichota bacterium]